jgi:TRAP-type mannitol/chloroaromatic compound transport system substrate-binding protein
MQNNKEAYAMKRRDFLTHAGAGAAAGIAATAVARPARAAVEWRMVTSWPRNFPGPGTSAQRLADRITAMSNGELGVRLYAAGELVPAFEVFDAVSQGSAELGHSASFFWRGKAQAAVFFTTVPFGLNATETSAWIHAGGGQALWDELYGGFGLRGFMAGNSGMQMGGWFRREIRGLDDLKGLKYRMPGLGGEVLRRLGAVAVSLPPGEILPALQSGAIDGAEFLGPWSDLAFGFYKVAPYYYWPGFHEPNGTSECLVNRKAFDALPAHLKAVVEGACTAENDIAMSEAEWNNSVALETLVARHGVKLRRFPTEVLRALKGASREVLADFAKGDDLTRRIHESYSSALRRFDAWSRLSHHAFLDARLKG